MNIIKQRGTATVEFAMMVPILLMLIFMVTELGTMFYRHNEVTKSVQDAARYLSDVSVNQKISLTPDQVKKLICSGDIGGIGSEIVPDCENKLDLDLLSSISGHVTVSVRYPADWILVGAVIAFLNLSGDPMELRASSVMRFTQ
jgi:CBS domain containing-hemolysin-like protein